MPCLPPCPPPWWPRALFRTAAELPDPSLPLLLSLPVRAEQGAIVVSAPSPFRRDYLRRLLPQLRRNASGEAGRPAEIRIEVAPPPKAAAAPKVQAGRAAPPAARKRRARPAGGQPLNGRAPHPAPAAPRAPAVAARAAAPLCFNFESFVAGRENELALAAVRCVARGHQPAANPIYVVAAAGMGKSHLARALVESLRRDGAAGVGYSTAGDFTSQFTGAVRRGDTAGFQRRYRSLRLLVLEDVQRLPRGKNATQLELIQTIEHVRMVGGRVVLTGDRLPREIEHLDGSLASHMASGLVAEMEAPGRALRRDILRDKASRFGLSIPSRFLDELAERARGSVRDLEGVVKQLLHSSLVGGGRQHMDRAMIEAALRKLAPRGGLEPADVIACICAAYAVSSEELRGRSRTRRVLEARQLAMYLCHHHCGASGTSYSRIGRALGRRHSSVKNGVARITERVGSDERLRLRLEELSRLLKSRRWPPPA